MGSEKAPSGSVPPALLVWSTPVKALKKQTLDSQTTSKGPRRERVEEVGKLEDISRHETRGEKQHHTIMGMMMLFCCTLRLVTD